MNPTTLLHTLLGASNADEHTFVRYVGPHVSEFVLDSYDLSGFKRVRFAAGSALVRVPPGADGSGLSHVVQNSGDTASLRIGSNCRAAMPRHGRLLPVEPLLTLPAISIVRSARGRPKRNQESHITEAKRT